MVKAFNPKADNVYLVGGAIRDEMLGRPVLEKDWVVVGAVPEDLKKQGFKQVGTRFPVFLSPETKEEYALARTELKEGTGHTGFICDFNPNITLEEDLKRRDLTINAIAKSQQGDIIDPFGGQRDLEARVIRHVSDGFSEDPLRLLRVARLTAELSKWDFQVADETVELLSSMAKSGELNNLTVERVWRETKRAFESGAASRYFASLANWGALRILWPEAKVDWPDSWAEKALAIWEKGQKQARAVPQGAYAIAAIGMLWPDADEAMMEDAFYKLQQCLKVPNLYHSFACRVASAASLYEHSSIEEMEMRLGRMGAYRKPDELPKVLACSSCLMQVKNNQWWRADLIQRMAYAAAHVSVRPGENGLQGAALGRHLKEKRHRIIASVLSAAADQTKT